MDGLRGIDTHCHHLPDDQFQNMGVKFLYDHSYCNWMDDLLGLLHSYSMSMQISAGNGRMARLWHTAILAKWNPIFEYIPIESQIEKFQDDYYDAIAKCHVEGESTVFIEFMLTQIDNTLAELLNQMTDSATDDAILDADGANHGADNMESRLLSGLKQNPYITQTDLAKELSLSRRTVQRIMKELMNDGKIKRVGSTRTGHWEIND